MDIQVNNTWVDFTPCFEDSIIMLAPSTLLLCISLLYIPYLLRSVNLQRNRSHLDTEEEVDVKYLARQVTNLSIVKLVSHS